MEKLKKFVIQERLRKRGWQLEEEPGVKDSFFFRGSYHLVPAILVLLSSSDPTSLLSAGTIGRITPG
jgi:hypothetical protein